MIWLIFSAIGGLLFGAVVAVSLTVFGIKKKITQKSVTDYSGTVGEEQKQEVEALIAEYTARYNKNAKGMIVRKTLGLKRRKKRTSETEKGEKGKSVDYMGLINEVAKIFRPSAYKPFLDLSEKQIFAFSREIISKVRAMLDASGLEIVKTIPVSTVLGATNLSQAIMKHGAVKEVAKAFGKCKKVVGYIGLANPVRYIKNYLNAVFICGAIKSVMRCTIRVVATETANLFSAPEQA